jgi:mRNA interferase MazF
MAEHKRGEVWLVDFGMAGKVRPAVVLSAVTPSLMDRALTTVVPHTTSTRDSQFEIVIEARFLEQGAFLVQNITSMPHAKFSRRLGTLTSAQMMPIEQAVRRWLGL